MMIIHPSFIHNRENNSLLYTPLTPKEQDFNTTNTKD